MHIMPTPNPNAAPPTDARAGVKTVISALAEGWNRHDMAAFAAAFRENADFVNVSGMQIGHRAQRMASPLGEQSRADG
jgi:hypothetical protein